jgi:hypothetical protein
MAAQPAEQDKHFPSLLVIVLNFPTQWLAETPGLLWRECSENPQKFR